MYSTLLSANLTMKDTLAAFNCAGDGKVSAAELHSMLAKMGASITPFQATELVRHMYADEEDMFSSSHPVEHFVSRSAPRRLLS